MAIGQCLQVIVIIFFVNVLSFTTLDRVRHLIVLIVRILLKRWRSTQFIVNIFEHYELVIKLIVFPEFQHFFYYHHDLKVFNNFIAFK